MTAELFREQLALVLEDVGRKYGFELADLGREELVVTEIAAEAGPEIVALVVTAGLGTVVCVTPELGAWVREHAPTDKHFRAMQPFFLADLAEEARRQGYERAKAFGTSLGFALARRPALLAAPEGLTLTRIDHEWMPKYRASCVFDNALGEPDETERVATTDHGFALIGRDGEPAGVAGIWPEGKARDEIGVDIVRAHRGLGLAKVLTAAATNDILERGRVPFYSCGATNIRSHRNALACGYEPALLMGMVALQRS